MPLGGQADVQVDLYSDAPMDAPFTVSAKPLLGSNLAFSWDSTSGNNGDVLTLTITRKGDASGVSGAGFFEIASTANGRHSVWIGAVGN